MGHSFQVVLDATFILLRVGQREKRNLKVPISEMLFGETANEAVEGDLRGMSAHRRTVSVHRYLLDVHVRVRELLLGTSGFGGPEYMCSLGQELGSMDARTFEEFIRCLLMWVRREYPDRALESGPLLSVFPGDAGLYDALVHTELSRTLRMMLSKWYSYYRLRCHSHRW